MIEKAKIIDPSELDHDRVHFGSTVTLCNLENDKEERYTICGVPESEPENGLISIHAPLSRALLGKEEGDCFSINLPAGKKEYEVVIVEYFPVFSLKKSIRSEKEFGFK